MEELHRQLLRIGFAAGDDLGLVLACGYAMCAHELVSRPSQDIDFATASALPLSTVGSRLANGETGPPGVADDEWDTYLDRW
ncbi:hypothetical protein [Micromonospora carbonacea]|uniref:hypothetical protein n=1 Tax=Micromonospora carbonacea TaxID=47853 RepID=UPI0037170A20